MNCPHCGDDGTYPHTEADNIPEAACSKCWKKHGKVVFKCLSHMQTSKYVFDLALNSTTSTRPEEQDDLEL